MQSLASLSIRNSPSFQQSISPHGPDRCGSVRRQQTPSPKQGKGVGKWLSLNLYPPFPSMNLQKQQLLLRLFRYFKSRKGEPRFFNKRNICLLAAAGAYILTPDEFLFDGIGRLGLLDDAAVILGAVLTVFFPDGD
ncbi:hypothetical protein CXT96_06095 [Akkermansia muciniphila]|jgi:hypothetical protein|nr:hypothetical protein CXT92_12235 [Akkermansia muciniphila]PNC92942.1 hypothetical protein CXT91_00770 [Akkermansia muciniphila]PND16473.1 hypothetical protein CXT96_06095 [Akkermansia muciniphila]BBP47949.1 hypothetical protein AKMU_06950 [Akkermansia muciniphila]GLU92495.1 hypothetical protein Amuc01_09390 [Akkermansia muciniphila]